MGFITKEMLLENLSGKVFGRLTVIKKLPKIPNQHIKYICQCECGKIKEVYAHCLKSGASKSCGCLKDESIIKRSTKHGNKTRSNPSPEYIAWVLMIQRCYNKNHPSYPNYGGRGITVCERWLHSFESYLADVGKRPSSKHSADRYPNNETGNYEPSNFRWATKREQAGNVRTNKWLEYKGKKLILMDWSRLLNIGQSTIAYRLNRKESFDSIVEFYIIKNKIDIQWN